MLKRNVKYKLLALAIAMIIWFYANEGQNPRIPREPTPKGAHVGMKLLDSPASRAVFVSPDTAGQPPFPYKVGDIVVRPRTVTVTGRPKQLMNVTTLRTETVDLAGRTTTFSERVRIIVPRGLTLAGSKYVRVTVKIERPSRSEEPSREGT